MREALSICAAGYLALLVIVSLFMLAGAGGNGRAFLCTGPMLRFEYAFPARPIACWLGEVP